MESSKYWSEMYVTKSSKDQSDEFIISKDPPIKFEYDNKKLILCEGIKESEYGEVSNFYQKYNRMSTGNTTLLPVSELERYLSISNISLLMRSANGMLIGTIISLLLPVKNSNGSIEEIIIHGCTTFLAIHPSLRKMGLCMALIRKLIELGYDKGLFCDYHMVAFPIGTNSISLNSWYRPIDLHRSKELGFLYDGLLDSHNSTKLRLKYRTTIPNNHTYVQVIDNNINISLNYYKELVKNKKFAFWPGEKLWSDWIRSYPTYLIYNKNKCVGIVSLNTVYCVIERTKETGRILFPIICDGEMDSVMPVICTIAKDLNYDVVYFHQHGSVTEVSLCKIKAIRTTTKLWFSLYNNCINLNVEDINVPLL
jgi:hypothetical protein